MTALSVRGLHKAFGPVQVLRGLDLEVPTGSLTAVLGPSGCGKSTLLRVIAGFERLDAGSVAVDGRVLSSVTSSLPPERRRVTIVPQEGALFPHLDVAANVAFGLSRRTPRRRARAADLLDLVGLAELAHRMPAELSGGQQQRVAVARALGPDPSLVLLDEPFSALDAGLRATVRGEVRTAIRAAGATAVLVTHDQEEALSTADQIAVMRDGVIVQSGSPQDVYLEPYDLDVARFVGESVELAATVRDGMATTALGQVPVRRTAGSGSGTVVLRPEQVVVSTSGDGVAAIVRRRVFYGHDTTLVLDVGSPDGTRLRVLSRTQGQVPAVDDVRVRTVGVAAFFPASATPPPGSGGSSGAPTPLDPHDQGDWGWGPPPGGSYSQTMHSQVPPATERVPPRAFVGISGWRYPPWRGTFYPPKLAQRRELEYAADRMGSVEINGSFYSLQRPASYQAWYEQTPPGFVFAVKGGRFITHMKKLRDVDVPLANFFASGVLALGDKLGPFLWQLPPMLPFDAARLADFFERLPRTTAAAALIASQHDARLDGRALTSTDADRPLRHALEIRHSSYVDPAFPALLRAHDIALVVADTAAKWPLLFDVTSDFVYVRLHGDQELYVSGYSDAALDMWAGRVHGWTSGSATPDGLGRDVYVYFDNDVKVRAPYDAMSLQQRLGPVATAPVSVGGGTVH